MGFSRAGFAAPFRALAEHWNGAAWKLAATAAVAGGDDTRLHGLAGAGPGDVWAVGSDAAPSGTQGTLIEHWNGAAWSRVPSPAGEAAGAELFSVSAVTASDIWAVGGTDVTNSLVEHWDGTAWSIIPSPPAGGGSLAAVAGRAVGPLVRRRCGSGLDLYDADPAAVRPAWISGLVD